MRKDIAGVQVTHGGKTMALSEWAREVGIPYATLRMRYTRGETEPAALFRAPPFRYRVRSVGDPPPRINLSLLDEMFPPETVAQLHEIARRADLSPLQVVLKIVKKRAAELASIQESESS